MTIEKENLRAIGSFVLWTFEHPGILLLIFVSAVAFIISLPRRFVENGRSAFDPRPKARESADDTDF